MEGLGTILYMFESNEKSSHRQQGLTGFIKRMSFWFGNPF